MKTLKGKYGPTVHLALGDYNSTICGLKQTGGIGEGELVEADNTLEVNCCICNKIADDCHSYVESVKARGKAGNLPLFIEKVKEIAGKNMMYKLRNPEPKDYQYILASGDAVYDKEVFEPRDGANGKLLLYPKLGHKFDIFWDTFRKEIGNHRICAIVTDTSIRFFRLIEGNPDVIEEIELHQISNAVISFFAKHG